jgi:hypothetical protein
MSYHKMSKAQIKNNEIITAWLRGQPYQMNSRDKNPQVPELSPWDVREKFTPTCPRDTGQFFSTREIAGEFRRFVEDVLAIDVTGKHILEPSAGLASLVEWTRDKAASVTCYELDMQLAEIGEKIEPWIKWVQNSPFDSKYEGEMDGRFDLVLANPPFGTTWGMVDAEEYCVSGAKRAEHRFLELIIRALKPDGVAVVIAPPTFLSNMPKKMATWMEANATVGASTSVQGQFELTNVATVIWSFGTKRESLVQAQPEAPVISWAVGDVAALPDGRRRFVREIRPDGRLSLEDGDLVGPDDAQKVIDFEAYAARTNASNLCYGEPALHRRAGANDAAWKRATDANLAEMQAWQGRRDAARDEYDRLVAEGRIRPRTSNERLEDKASGDPAMPGVQAAQRVLQRRAERAAGAGDGVSETIEKIKATQGKIGASIESLRSALEDLPGANSGLHEGGAVMTPVQARYAELERRYPTWDKNILMIRLGDFYEAFGDMAETLARELDIVLTSRPLGPGRRIPMAGIPCHAFDEYRDRLNQLGYHVILAERVEDSPRDGVFCDVVHVYPVEESAQEAPADWQGYQQASMFQNFYQESLNLEERVG